MQLPMRRNCALLLFTALCAAASVAPVAAKPKITTFDPTGSIATYAWTIDDKDAIAGFRQCFVRSADGTIATFDHPGSAVTAAFGIDAKGASTGYWTTTSGEFPG